MTDLRKLAALRREATPGPWMTQGPLIHGPDGGGIEVGPLLAEVFQDWDEATDAAYIAAAGSLTAEEWDALAGVVEAAGRSAWLGAADNYGGPTEQALDALRAALDRLQETTP